MKITFVNFGDTKEKYLKEGLVVYEKRLKHYSTFDMVFLPELRQAKNLPATLQKEQEGRVILSSLDKTDFPVLLDVSGRCLNSEDFARYLQQIMNRGVRNLSFITGGAFGFSDEVYQAVPERISLSPMTFSHQMVRLIFLEQLYRAFTIIRGEPYHHQ